jgi:hypothetical protein
MAESFALPGGVEYVVISAAYVVLGAVVDTALARGGWMKRSGV